MGMWGRLRGSMGLRLGRVGGKGWVQLGDLNGFGRDSGVFAAGARPK